MKIHTIAVLTLLAAMSSALGAQTFEVGEPFPALKLPRLDGGGLTSLEAFRGRKLVLHVWASW